MMDCKTSKLGKGHRKAVPLLYDQSRIVLPEHIGNFLDHRPGYSTVAEIFADREITGKRWR